MEGAYQPAPGSPGPQINNKTHNSSDEEDDPLDAFMAGIEQEVCKLLFIIMISMKKSFQITFG